MTNTNQNRFATTVMMGALLVLVLFLVGLIAWCFLTEEEAVVIDWRYSAGSVKAGGRAPRVVDQHGKPIFRMSTIGYHRLDFAHHYHKGVEERAVTTPVRLWRLGRKEFVRMEYEQLARLTVCVSSSSLAPGEPVPLSFSSAFHLRSDSPLHLLVGEPHHFSIRPGFHIFGLKHKTGGSSRMAMNLKPGEHREFELELVPREKRGAFGVESKEWRHPLWRPKPEFRSKMNSWQNRTYRKEAGEPVVLMPDGSTPATVWFRPKGGSWQFWDGTISPGEYVGSPIHSTDSNPPDTLPRASFPLRGGGSASVRHHSASWTKNGPVWLQAPAVLLHERLDGRSERFVLASGMHLPRQSWSRVTRDMVFGLLPGTNYVHEANGLVEPVGKAAATLHSPKPVRRVRLRVEEVDGTPGRNFVFRAGPFWAATDEMPADGLDHPLSLAAYSAGRLGDSHPPVGPDSPDSALLTRTSFAPDPARTIHHPDGSTDLVLREFPAHWIRGSVESLLTQAQAIRAEGTIMETRTELSVRQNMQNQTYILQPFGRVPEHVRVRFATPAAEENGFLYYDLDLRPQDPSPRIRQVDLHQNVAGARLVRRTGLPVKIRLPSGRVVSSTANLSTFFAGHPQSHLQEWHEYTGDLHTDGKRNWALLQAKLPSDSLGVIVQVSLDQASLEIRLPPRVQISGRIAVPPAHSPQHPIFLEHQIPKSWEPCPEPTPFVDSAVVYADAKGRFAFPHVREGPVVIRTQGFEHRFEAVGPSMDIDLAKKGLAEKQKPQQQKQLP